LDGEEASSRAAEAKVDQARAVAEERRSALDKSRVRAPVTGQVGVRNAEVGMLVSQGAVLFQVGNLDRVQIEVPLTENMLGRVRAGQPVRVRARGHEQEEVEATLSRISPFLEEGSFSTVGEVDLDNATGRFSPGMFVQVRILYGASERATLVPANCLWEDPDSGRKGVFVIDDSDGLVEPRGRSTESSEQRRSLHFRTVQVAAEGGGIAGVSGIEEGDWIVVTGQQLLEAEERFEAEDMSESEDKSESENQSATFTARVRPISWERVLELQGLQREDLLRGFLAKQQRVASVLGAEIPTDEAEIEKRLEEHARENATAATSGGN
jgi:RND family efflux transporter MFP subunit